MTEGELRSIVRRVAESRYDEGYERGVHDHDAAAILNALLRLHAGAGLLRYPPAARAAAQLFWAFGTDEAARLTWTARAVSLARARALFGRVDTVDETREALGSAVATFMHGLEESTAEQHGEGVFDWPGSISSRSWPAGSFGFVTSAGARSLLERFDRVLGRAQEFEGDLRALGDDLRRAPSAGPRPGSAPSSPRPRRRAAGGGGRTAVRGVAARLVGGPDRHGRRPARRASADHRTRAGGAPGRVPRPDPALPRPPGPRLPRLPAAAQRAGRRRARAPAPGGVPARR